MDVTAPVKKATRGFSKDWKMKPSKTALKTKKALKVNNEIVVKEINDDSGDLLVKTNSNNVSADVSASNTEKNSRVESVFNISAPSSIGAFSP